MMRGIGIVGVSPIRFFRRSPKTKKLSMTICLLLAGASLAADNYPPDVSEYVARREVCEHFRAEPWPEGASEDERERREFISARLKDYCEGTDQALRELRAKYRDDRVVMDRLQQYDAHVCAGQTASKDCAEATGAKTKMGAPQ